MPEKLMPLQDVLEFYKKLSDDGIKIWIDGGWGVDALLGKQTRTHGDLDIAIQLKDVTKVREWLETQGYVEVNRDSDWNFVLKDTRCREIDFHIFVFDDKENIIAGIQYPYGSLTGIGLIGDCEVHCISPEHMVQFHTGYTLRESDFKDVSALCEKFDLDYPKEYIDLLNSAFYNTFSDSLDKIPFEEHLLPLLLKYLPTSCNILEIGSGAGALAAWLSKHGHTLTCIEPAENPAKKALERGLSVHQMRFQDFPLSQQFDSILAISSLIHIPKSDLPTQIKKLSQLLNSYGIAFITMIEGHTEGYEDPTGKGQNRFFSKFSQDEVTALLSPFFSIIEIHKIEVKKMNQIFFLLVLKQV